MTTKDTHMPYTHFEDTEARRAAHAAWEKKLAENAKAYADLHRQYSGFHRAWQKAGPELRQQLVTNSLIGEQLPQVAAEVGRMDCDA
jgi:hypothetical protein